MKKFLRAPVSGLLPLGLLIAAPFEFAYAQGNVAVIEANQPPVAVFAPLKGNSGGHGGGKATKNLVYHGGSVQTGPKIYLVLWGSQWNNNDPSGESGILQSFYSGVGGSSWLSTVTQYCEGVPSGTTFCNGAGMPSGDPAGMFAGLWADNASAAPSSPSQAQLAAEAVKAAQHFGNTSSSQNLNAQYVIATATRNSASGFGTQYCAWHSATSSSVGIVAYTNLPYITDAGASCGANFNNLGPNAGITIVGGHEMAESITDPNPDSGWVDQQGSEIGDKCAWISTGQGATASVMFSNGYYPVQSLWSNTFNSDAGGCVQ